MGKYRLGTTRFNLASRCPKSPFCKVLAVIAILTPFTSVAEPKSYTHHKNSLATLRHVPENKTALSIDSAAALNHLPAASAGILNGVLKNEDHILRPLQSKKYRRMDKRVFGSFKYTNPIVSDLNSLPATAAGVVKDSDTAVVATKHIIPSKNYSLSRRYRHPSLYR